MVDGCFQRIEEMDSGEWSSRQHNLANAVIDELLADGVALETVTLEEVKQRLVRAAREAQCACGCGGECVAAF